MPPRERVFYLDGLQPGLSTEAQNGLWPRSSLPQGRWGSQQVGCDKGRPCQTLHQAAKLHSPRLPGAKSTVGWGGVGEVGWGLVLSCCWLSLLAFPTSWRKSCMGKRSQGRARAGDRGAPRQSGSAETHCGKVPRVLGAGRLPPPTLLPNTLEWALLLVFSASAEWRKRRRGSPQATGTVGQGNGAPMPACLVFIF